MKRVAQSGSLIEVGVFKSRKTQMVRMLFNAVPKDAEARQHPPFAELESRLHAVEEREGDARSSA